MVYGMKYGKLDTLCRSIHNKSYLRANIAQGETLSRGSIPYMEVTSSCHRKEPTECLKVMGAMSIITLFRNDEHNLFCQL